MNTPDWLGPACDLLRENFPEEAGALLEAAPAKADLLERAVEIFERSLGETTHIPLGMSATRDGMLAIVAEHRGETPEQALARLGPARFAVEFSNETWASPAPAEIWNADRATAPLADLAAIWDFHRTRYSVPPRSPIEPEPEPDPVARSVRNPGLAGYLRPKVAAGHNAPSRTRRRSP